MFPQVGVYLNEPIKIDELNQLTQPINSTLVIDPAEITTIIFKMQNISNLIG